MDMKKDAVCGRTKKLKRDKKEKMEKDKILSFHNIEIKIKI